MSGEKMRIQRYNLQYFCIDGDKVWFVACQLEQNLLFYYDLKADRVKYAGCIASYTDISRRYGYCVLGRMNNKIIIAPYQSLEKCFIEYDLNTGNIARRPVPSDYYACSAYKEGKEEFVEVMEYEESLFFFSSKRKALVEYNGNTEQYFCHRELENIMPDTQCGMTRHSIIRQKELVYIPVYDSNVVVEYSLRKHAGRIYIVPFDFKNAMLTIWDNKFVISSLYSYDLVFWDKEQGTFDFVGAGDIAPKDAFPRLLPQEDILLLAPWTPEGIWCFVDKTGQIKKYEKNKKAKTFCDVVYTDYDLAISLCYRFPEAILEIYDLEKNSYKEVCLRCNDEKYIKDLISLDCDSYIDEGYMPLDIFLERI